MLTVDEALRLILAEATPGAPAVLPLAETLGCVLAENVTSDVDSPPHDKAMVDGYAIVSADLASGSAELRYLEEVTAGEVPRKTVGPGFATRIMTGAPLPPGADAVVMIERTKYLDDAPGNAARVKIVDRPPRSGQNIMRRATSLSRGQTVLATGREIRPAEIGVAAEVGRAALSVLPPTTVGVLATGNELVEPHETPGPGQIRNSNGPLLTAAIQQAGGQAIDLGIVRDDAAALAERISAGLQQARVLVLSGGVSAGVLDLVPGALQKLGVEQAFHKVNLKPGKPLWFGVQRRATPPRLVFGLPGNPVSTLVCFALFVRPAMQKIAGRTDVGHRPLQAVLTADHVQRGDRATYFPATLDQSVTPPRVTPLAWHGSADLCGFSRANALAIFPPGDRQFAAGETIDVLTLA